VGGKTGRALQEIEPRPGQGDTLAIAIEEPCAELLLEAFDLHRERRLRNMQSLRGTAEVELLGHDREGPHAAEGEAHNPFVITGALLCIGANQRARPRCIG